MPPPATSPTRPCADSASQSRALPLGGANSGSSARSPAARSSAICSPRHSRLFTATPVLQSPGATNQRLRDCGASAPARASRKSCPDEEPVKRPAEGAAISTTEAAGSSASPTQIGAGAPSTGSSAISAPPCPRRSTARAAIVIGAFAPPTLQTTARQELLSEVVLSESPAGHAAKGARPRRDPTTFQAPSASRRSIDSAISDEDRARASSRLPACAAGSANTCAPAPVSVFEPAAARAPSSVSTGSARRNSVWFPLSSFLASLLSALESSPSLGALRGLAPSAASSSV